MPLLYAFGHFAALKAVLLEGERLFAFLNDIFGDTSPNRVGPCIRQVYVKLGTQLLRSSSIQINGGKRQVWSASGKRPQASDLLERLSPEGACSVVPNFRRRSRGSESAALHWDILKSSMHS